MNSFGVADTRNLVTREPGGPAWNHFNSNNSDTLNYPAGPVIRISRKNARSRRVLPARIRKISFRSSVVVFVSLRQSTLPWSKGKRARYGCFLASAVFHHELKGDIMGSRKRVGEWRYSVSLRFPRPPPLLHSRSLFFSGCYLKIPRR